MVKVVTKNKIEYFFLRILAGAGIFERQIPFMRIVSGKRGPLVWLTGCMHGDEIGGTVSIHEIFRRVRNKLTRGALYAFPLLNPFGFEQVTRHIPLSKEDLNRVFPGKANGSLAQRIAHQVYSKILATKPTLLIDLHNDWNKSIPYTLIDEEIGDEKMTQQVHELAEATGLLIIEDSEVIPGALTTCLIRQGVPALTLELGESMIINERNIELGVKAVLNILKHLGMIEDHEHIQDPLATEFKGQILKYSSLPLSSTSGIIRFFKQPGQQTIRGEKIAAVVNPFGQQVEVIKSLASGIVLGHVDQAVTYPGAAVMAFGTVDDRPT